MPSSRQQQGRRAGYNNHQGGKETRLPIDAVVSATPGLRAAPLGDRVCAAFSSERDGRMSFEDYLDMVSVMSDRANPEVVHRICVNIPTYSSYCNFNP